MTVRYDPRDDPYVHAYDQAKEYLSVL
ncbi:hypothetical protein ICN84_04060 [Akkermansia glycaniphila]|nr:hypothetical protein [Akkermansia glycaniphila]